MRMCPLLTSISQFATRRAEESGGTKLWRTDAISLPHYTVMKKRSTKRDDVCIMALERNAI